MLLFRRLQHECLQSGELGHCHAHWDDAGRKWWHALSDEEREKIDLFVSGRGTTFDAAMKSANEKAVIAAAPTPAAQGGDGHE